MNQWHWIDLTIIGVIALSMLMGMVRGFVKELIALCVWALALYVAYNYSSLLDPLLQKYIADQTAKTVVSFVIVLVGVLIAGGIVNASLGVILKKTGLSGPDRMLGIGFGFVRGVLIVAFVLTALKMTSLPHEQFAKDSVLYARFDPLVSWFDSKIPEVIKQAKSFDKQHLVDISDSMDIQTA